MKILIATLMLASARLYASEDGQKCSNATLQGDYAFTVTGTRPTGPGTPLEQFVGWTITSFDGDGGGTQIGASHGSINGDSTDDSGTVVYSLNPDCSGTGTLELPGRPVILRLWIVVMDDGKEVHIVVRAPLADPPGPASNLTIAVGRKVRASDSR